MADQNLLSHLCAIWYVRLALALALATRCTALHIIIYLFSNRNISHINVPQYRCPRCSCKTCSVQCVKRHKEWHQCSGKRDPTAKVPKAQLFTPAGIDHDFNFISGIQRSRAHLETKVPQSMQIEGNSMRAGIASKNKNILDRLDMTRVNIEWAPEGLSRQKLNQTKWSKVTKYPSSISFPIGTCLPRFQKTRQIVWTVEWIHQDGDKDLRQVHDSAPICREYTPVFLKHNKVESGRKRKRGTTALSKSDAAAEHEAHAQAPSSLSPSSHEAEFEKDCVNPVEPALSVQTAPVAIVKDIAGTQKSGPSDTAGQNKPDSAEGAVPQTLPPNTSPVSELLRQPPGSSDDRGNYYYLLKPRTTGTEKVLIVLSPTDSLLDCLRDQTILEFPSIQVLSKPPHSLPHGFILVHDWLERFEKEQEEMKCVLHEAGDLDVGEILPDVDEDHLPLVLQTMSNDNDIMSMLQQDVLGRNNF